MVLEITVLVAARGLAALAEAQAKVMQVAGQVPIPAKYPAAIGLMRRQQRGNNASGSSRIGHMKFSHLLSIPETLFK